MTFGYDTLYKHAFSKFCESKTINCLHIHIYCQITPEEHVSIEEVMSQRSHDHVGGERRGRREGDALVRLRMENELTPPVSVSDT